MTATVDAQALPATYPEGGPWAATWYVRDGTVARATRDAARHGAARLGRPERVVWVGGDRDGDYEVSCPTGRRGRRPPSPMSSTVRCGACPPRARINA